MNIQTAARAIDAAIDPYHWFADANLALRIERVAGEVTPWEVFRGHLLDAAQTTQTRTFDAWHVFLDASGEPAETPLVSVGLDRAARQIVVTRQILTRGHEAYEDPPGVIHSRPVEKWVRELVGTIEIDRIPDDELELEIRTYLMLAVIGTSRLPITSLEAPLPAFSLGKLAYFPNLASGERSWWKDPVCMLGKALADKLSDIELAKVLETALRATADENQGQLLRVLGAFAARSPQGAQRICAMVSRLFQQVALSPYTEFVERLLALLDGLAECDSLGPDAVVDLVGYMLRHLCRHLTAFDLTTFHNYGANYPDALFLDGLLKLYLRLIERHGELLVNQPADDEFKARAKRLRCRALRQACLVRKHYEGLLVPDAPTSQGENLRVLPAPYGRVPEDQILQPGRRGRALFADEPLEKVLTSVAREMLQASLADLDLAAELRELGTATFLDRPLGVCKLPGEVDRTPLVSYTAFSRVIIERRLGELERAGWIDSPQRQLLAAAVETLPAGGVPIESLEFVQRPGVVSLVDAQRAAADFVVMRANRASQSAVLGLYDWSAIDDKLWDELSAPPPERAFDGTLMQSASELGTRAQPTLQFYDARGRIRAELKFDAQASGSVRFIERGGVEFPERLQVLRVWERAAEGGEWVERDMQSQHKWITRREPQLIERALGPPT